MKNKKTSKATWVEVVRGDEGGFELKEDSELEDAKGSSLVLITDWVTDSAINDSGFSEAAADNDVCGIGRSRPGFE